MKTLRWIKAQGRRFAIFALKLFLPYFFYLAVKNLSRRLFSSQPNEEGGGKEKEERKFLIFEEPIPPLYQNRRIVTAAGTNSFLFYLRCLRDSFPDDERFQFAWGGFQANGSLSLTIFPDLIAQKNITISMETPLIGRRTFDESTTRDSGYFRIALYNTSNLNRGDFSLPAACDDARLRRLLRTTRTSVKPYRKTGEHIVYALQVPQDTSLVGLDVFSAAQHDLVALRYHTSRPIILAANPAMLRDAWAAQRIRSDTKIGYLCLKELCKNLGIAFHERFEKDQDSSIFLRNCWCVVCHSSGFAVDAVLAGVPAITLHRSNFVYPICSHELSEIENPKMPNRIPWFSRLAYCQWTLEEIENGDVWRHFQPTVERLLENK